jgi:hypothetical protein
MHSEDGDEDVHHVSNYYGLLPGVVGLLFGGALIWLMFALADGFA